MDLAVSRQLEGFVLRQKCIADPVTDQLGGAIVSSRPAGAGRFAGRDKKTGEPSQQKDRRSKEDQSQQEASHEGEPGLLPDFSDLSLSISVLTASMSNPPGFRSWTFVKAFKALS